MADNSKWKGKNLSYMTPQMLHAMKMSQTQSQNNYKKSYNEEFKGKGSTATDTVETRRIKKLTSEQSLLNYHKDFEKSKSKGYTAVTETPELNRIRQQQSHRVNYKKEFMEQKGHNIPVTETPETIRVKKQQNILSDIKYQEDREKLKGKATQVTDDPATRRAMEAAKIASDVEYKKSKEKSEEMERRRLEMLKQKDKVYKRVAPPGSAAIDYVASQRMKELNLKDKEPETSTVAPPQSPKQVQEVQKLPEPPAEEVIEQQITPEPEPTQVEEPEAAYVEESEPANVEEPELASVEEPEPAKVEEPELEEFVRSSDGHVYKAMYDYSAQDDDEVTFADGDRIIDAQRIDDGWMFGTVERTGQTGMLPSNYVKVIE